MNDGEGGGRNQEGKEVGKKEERSKEGRKEDKSVNLLRTQEKKEGE